MFTHVTTQYTFINSLIVDSDVWMVIRLHGRKQIFLNLLKNQEIL
jgi:hypothetical protein